MAKKNAAAKRTVRTVVPRISAPQPVGMKPPDVQLVAIAFADGTVGVMSFVTAEYGRDGRPRWVRQPTETRIEQTIFQSEFGPGKKPVKGWRFIKAGDVPEDRSFRDAWTDDGKAFGIDMDKARQVRRRQLRDDANRAAKLRLPPNDAVEAARTLEQLKAIKP